MPTVDGLGFFKANIRRNIWYPPGSESPGHASSRTSTIGRSNTGRKFRPRAFNEAAVLAVKLFRADPWLERIGPATVLEVEIREPTTKHAISLQQVERWLAGATTNPNEASRKAKLKMMLVQR